MENVRIYDTSLRDGLRNSGIEIALGDKVRFAQALERLGVSDIEVGFGGPSQIETMEALAGAVTEPVLYGLSRVNRRDLDRVLEALAKSTHPGANIFSPVSEKFLGYANSTPAQALDRSVAAVAHARSAVEHVVFSAQDAPGADRTFLREILAAVIEAGATAISIADTASQALPDEFGPLFGKLGQDVKGGRSVVWSVHCHNDMGMAVANCAAAIQHGARQIECTVSGIGERNSNTPMQAIGHMLQKRADAFPGLHCALDIERFSATESLLAEIARPTDNDGSGVAELLQRWRPA